MWEIVTGALLVAAFILGLGLWSARMERSESKASRRRTDVKGITNTEPPHGNNLYGATETQGHRTAADEASSGRKEFAAFSGHPR